MGECNTGECNTPKQAKSKSGQNKIKLKLKYRFEIEINSPLDDVIELFRDRDHLSKWQRGLLSSEPLPLSDGQLKYELTYQMGRRKMRMTETIVRDELPEHYDVIYKMKGVYHSVNNSFYSSGPNSTKWISEVEFRFSGLMKLIAGFMKSGFEQQSLALMHSFKTFAEKSDW